MINILVYARWPIDIQTNIKGKHEYLSRLCVIKMNICFFSGETLLAFIGPLCISLYIKYTYCTCSKAKLAAVVWQNTGNATEVFYMSNYLQIL